MAQIRINALPSEAAPNVNDVMPLDGATTRKATIVAVVDAARPFASQAEAEAGASTTTGMNPLRTAQAIAAQGAVAFATNAQGALAATALQTAQLGTTVQAHGATLDSLEALALVAGDVLYATAADTVTRLPIGTTDQALSVVAGVPAWKSLAGTGDMTKAVYDPTTINASPFARANHTGTQAIITVVGLQTAIDKAGVQVPNGRLTLTSGTAITTADAAGQTSVYYTPCAGNRIPIYDGTNILEVVFTELTLALDSNSGHTNYHQSGKLFDFFVINDAGTIRLGTGPQWTTTGAGTSARGTGAATTELELYLGFWVNKNTMTVRFGSASGNTVSVPARQATFVGTGCMTANGQIDDSKAKRYLSNAYNKVERTMYYNSPTASYIYTTATLRQVEASANSQLNFIIALPGDVAKAFAAINFNNSTATQRTVVAGIGLNQTTAITDVIHRVQAYGTSSSFGLSTATWVGNPGIGLNFLAWLEQGAGADAQTMFPFAGMAGISGTVLA